MKIFHDLRLAFVWMKFTGVYIGNSGSAKNINYLKRVGITHVLNTAKGFEDYAGVNTNSAFYEPYNIKYLGLDLCDYPQANIAQYFDSSSHFIENALKDGAGKVLVHCFMGMSRSSTITAAFLMIKRDMSARDALILLRKSRHIFPNSGFLEALADLDYELARERENP
ncbi:UNVERIFIED_CONTAM: hypothetical protein GTU68_024834 [Idotea baltica]|nr:hypothetical protein [Idotea baltica]